MRITTSLEIYVDAQDGAHSCLPEAQHLQASPGAQDLPLFAARGEDHGAWPRPVY